MTSRTTPGTARGVLFAAYGGAAAALAAMMDEEYATGAGSEEALSSAPASPSLPAAHAAIASSALELDHAERGSRDGRDGLGGAGLDDMYHPSATDALMDMYLEVATPSLQATSETRVGWGTEVHDGRGAGERSGALPHTCTHLHGRAGMCGHARTHLMPPP